MESLALMARQSHQQSAEHERLAGHFREQRNRAIRELYAGGDYSYTTLAEVVGVTRDLVAKIVTNA